MIKCECRPILKGTGTVTGGNLTIALPNTTTVSNGDIIRFVVINAIDETNPLGTVSVTLNGATFALKTKFGNDVRIDQLRARKVYTVGVGAQTPTMTMLTCIPVSAFAFPTYSVTTTTGEGA